MIPFNKPYITGRELEFISDAVACGHISGNGKYTKLCQKLAEESWRFHKCLLTTSCTDALEMAAILLDIKPGDEVIMPSFTFVSTALAFVRQGAKVVFADSRSDHPGIDEHAIEHLITKKTRAIVVVHYAGIAVDMKPLMEMADRYKIPVVEDAAQAIDSFYIRDGATKALGSFGVLSAFSFHETKNIQSGEGGMLVINDPKLVKRAEIIWEKGTNRAEFFRGEVNKYGWVDVGSSFLPADTIAAFLYAQLIDILDIQQKRRSLWNNYNRLFESWNSSRIQLPFIPDYATNNGHMFYLVLESFELRQQLISHLKANGVLAVFHYLPLHLSDYYRDKHDGRSLPNSEYFADRLLRLPLYYELTFEQQKFIVELIHDFFEKTNQ
ncbi:MAG: dTDP-4-amino-4,6-dideoxygalactose transaminase [Bacteroidetes bacterium]|nr:dTDP-4-amino-4,6-dideoxygalactose transaminase [Bacteroidota bacterium]MBU1578062.1 dTDP-4-amino-4,6-dideoxygalactose transaminase [Bacteroidota bacterium]MBU2466426.1 dTDP-4-amino-4,6-dideoxygalactose transaminase [Bacteroidota bacterium]MBU2556862.1 dTDP-4-amino-4,6-dideoxygalactose transaminase [Bacteroidota bacterium]